MSVNKNIILNPRSHGNEILEFDIAEASEEYAKVFGANKNLYRTTPSMIDGLKPVQRRVLYGLSTNENKGKKFRKASRVAGDVMGRFHPHGDASISEVIGNMAQNWNWNVLMLCPQGNFGSIRGDDVGAGRYIETKLSAFSHKCFFTDIDKCNVPMRLTYTGEEYEPDYLPAMYPTVLINPQLSSIGYGLASNIPPFNFNEVIKATIKLMENPNANIQLIPDSPTGCDIVDEGIFKDINRYGIGKFTLKSGYDIDYMNNIIDITSLPLQVTSEMVIHKISDLRNKGKFDEIEDINDDTNNSTVSMHIILYKNADPDKVLKKLMDKDTGLRKTYPCEIRVIDDFQSVVYGPKDLLLNWIEYRKDCVRSIYNEKIITAMSDYHMNEVLILITESENLKKTQDMIFKSKNKDEAKKKLIKEYKITTMQADTVAKMGMFDFTEDRRNEYRQKKIELTKSITEYENILDSDDAIDNVIKEQLLEGVKLFGRNRISKIIKDNKSEVKVANTMHLVGVSKDGYIKKISFDNQTSIGSVGKVSSIMAININNRDNLLVFDGSGMISRISVDALPDMNYDDIGVEISRYFKVNGGVVGIIRESDIKDHYDSSIVLVTEKGFGKKTSISEFKKIKDSTIAIALDDEDHLVAAIPSLDTDDFIVYTNFGDGIRLSTKDFKLYKKTAKGLSLISLKQNEKVVGIDLLYDGMKSLLYITSSGRLKRTDIKYFPVMKRKDEAISLIALENGETLLGVRGVLNKDKLICYRKKSGAVELLVKDVPMTTRVAKAEKMIKTPKGDIIIAYKIIR